MLLLALHKVGPSRGAPYAGYGMARPKLTLSSQLELCQAMLDTQHWACR